MRHQEQTVRARLIGGEASPEALQLWQSRIAATDTDDELST